MYSQISPELLEKHLFLAQFVLTLEVLCAQRQPGENMGHSAIDGVTRGNKH
jgi:hypothetical protein